MYQVRKKILADIVAICGRGRELFRPPTYIAHLLDWSQMQYSMVQKFLQVQAIFDLSMSYIEDVQGLFYTQYIFA
jgi:hypothetical protein